VTGVQTCALPIFIKFVDDTKIVSLPIRQFANLRGIVFPSRLLSLSRRNGRYHHARAESSPQPHTQISATHVSRNKNVLIRPERYRKATRYQSQASSYRENEHPASMFSI